MSEDGSNRRPRRKQLATRSEATGHPSTFGNVQMSCSIIDAAGGARILHCIALGRDRTRFADVLTVTGLTNPAGQASLGFGRAWARLHLLKLRQELENGCGAAAEDSPRREPWGTDWETSKPWAGGAKEKWWGAQFFRRSAALAQITAQIGLRRGLPSIATPWLGIFAVSP